VKQLQLCIVIHNHQPTGNFDGVIEEAYRLAYLPFLEALEEQPHVRIALHNSGCLWEWLEARHPEYGRRVEALVASGRIELMGGGFFEPILPLWPERDRRGQIRRMSRFLRERFGVEPRGIWLAERVWEPHLASDLAAEGIEYLCLDDTQLLQVGVKDEDLRGYYLTEDSGAVVAVYPIQMRLRYEIPFAPPEQVIETLRASADPEPGTMRLFGDDGEKFGVWPGTHKLCYGEGWLRRFFDRLGQEGSWLSLALPSEHRMRTPPRGRIYLPAGSYREMTEWALPPDAQEIFSETSRFLRDSGRGDAEALLLKGGTFRNFLVRYAESNQMHKRCLLAHSRLDEAGDISEGLRDEIRDHLWRAQCNCAYWHGVFGGLYLPHLRDAIYREILTGEGKLDRAVRGSDRWAEAALYDYDGDGEREAILRSDRLELHVSPRCGGGVLELDDKVGGRNLVNTLTRRREAYHARFRKEESASDDGARTIHGRFETKEEGLDRFLRYDRGRRMGLSDRIFLTPPTIEDVTGEGGGLGCGARGGAYEADLATGDGWAEAILRGRFTLDSSGERGVAMSRTLRIHAGESRVDVICEIRSLAAMPLRFHFGLEWILNLLAGRAPDRFVLVDGVKPEDPHLAGTGAHPGAASVSLVDEWSGTRVDLSAEGAAAWFRGPLETVSLSETGAERVFQGTILTPVWEIDLGAGAAIRKRMSLAISHSGASSRSEGGPAA